MSKQIVCHNSKGGVSKTSSTCSIGVVLAEKGNKVLLCDFDPQRNLSFIMGVPEDFNNTLVEYFENKCLLKDCIFQSRIENLDVLPSQFNLYDYLNNQDSIKLLHKDIVEIADNYDYIIIDTHPALLSFLTRYALSIADKVIIPVNADILAMEGLRHLLKHRESFKNEQVEMKVFLSMAHKSFNVTKSVEKALNGFDRFKTSIPFSTFVSKAHSKQRTIVEIDKKNPVSQAYYDLAKEVLI